MSDLVVVDLGTGNLHSVGKALERVAPGQSIKVTRAPQDIAAAQRVVLPGQGAIGSWLRALANDDLEQVLKDAITSKPVLGICRGAQLMNVVLGGTLYTDLRPFRRLTSNRRMLLPRKHLQVDAGTLLESILQAQHCRINSLHHQAIRDLGQGLKISGRDRDAIVQAVENPDHPFRVGVQWHPEYLPQQRPQLRLFQQLVDTAKAL